jgi:hypothetical protein
MLTDRQNDRILSLRAMLADVNDKLFLIAIDGKVTRTREDDIIRKLAHALDAARKIGDFGNKVE